MGRVGNKCAFSLLLLFITLLFLIPTASAQAAAFRPGDVGFSLVTPKGTVWIYGDSWDTNGNFIRNAITLNGKYQGTIIHRMPKGHWMWLGAPFLLANGKVGVYGSEMIQKSKGMWGFKRVGQVYVEFDPKNVKGAQTTRIDKTSTPWSCASAVDGEGPLVYTVDSKHHPRVGRPQADGSVKPLATLEAQLSGHFSVIQDDKGKWWMVGTGIMLSRRVWAYPMESPQGPVNGKKRLLTTLPSPGAANYVYHVTIHPEENGLLTYAINGSGPGSMYMMKRISNFWKSAPTPSADDDSNDLPSLPDIEDGTDEDPLPGD